MKIKKSAGSAALKTTSTPTTNHSATATPVAPVKTTAVASAAQAKTAPVASVAPAPAKTVAATPTSTATAKSAPASSAAVTTIDVKIDVGYGNAVYLRGEGSGLTWEQGKPLVCVDGGTWRWSQTVSAPITFKLLLNDKVWSAGGDMVVKPGQKIEVAPRFA